MDTTANIRDLGDASALSSPASESHWRSGDIADEVTIGEIAAELSVSLRASRYYEDRRLLHPRREGATRLYGANERSRLNMILSGKELGFTLTEIGELIGTEKGNPDFEGKLQPAQISAQIDHLERQRRGIDNAICAAAGRVCSPSRDFWGSLRQPQRPLRE